MARSHSIGTRRMRRGFSLGGLLLVALGTLLLLNTTGVVRPGIWFELLFTYWPVLLVLIGLRIILAPRAPLVCAGVVVLILAGTVGAAFLTMSAEQSDDMRRITYSAPLNNTETLQLGMGFAAGKITLSAEPYRSSSRSRLLAADFGGHSPTVIHEQSGRFTEIYLSTEGPVIQFSSGSDSYAISSGYANGSLDESVSEHGGGFSLGGMVDWDLRVSSDVAVDIEIRAGAADLYLDLRALDVQRLDIGAAASDIRILLPDNAGQTHVEIAAGAADIEIVVPRGVAARIANDTFLSSTRIDSARFPETGYGYQSPGYSTAENRVDIEIDGAAVDVTVS